MPLARISEISHVALATDDLDGTRRIAERILHLDEVESTSKRASFTANGIRPEIFYTKADRNAVGHVGLAVSDTATLDEIRDRVIRGGYPLITEHALEGAYDHAFAFTGPEGFVWQIHAAQGQYERKTGTAGPDRFGHVNLQVTDTIAVRDFLMDVLDFRVSDQIGADSAFFLRCNSEHHGVALMKADRPKLHHHAWRTQSVTDLVKLGDRLARTGSRLLWGPVRHGAGNNIAAYFVEPTGAIIELYTDMEHIFDDTRPAHVWDDTDPYWLNQWDGLVPDGVMDHGAPLHGE